MKNNKEEIKRKLEIIKTMYPSDGGEFVTNVTKDYEKLLEEKIFLSHPIFKDIVSNIKSHVNVLNVKLLNDEYLTEKERDKIFAQKDVYRVILALFNVENKDEALEELQKLIDSKLD